MNTDAASDVLKDFLTREMDGDEKLGNGASLFDNQQKYLEMKTCEEKIFFFGMGGNAHKISILHKSTRMEQFLSILGFLPAYIYA